MRPWHQPSDSRIWYERAHLAAPTTPAWIRHKVGFFLNHPRADSDVLLALADMLIEASETASLMGLQATLAPELRRLADLPRRLAPFRAEDRRTIG